MTGLGVHTSWQQHLVGVSVAVGVLVGDGHVGGDDIILIATRPVEHGR